MLKEYFAWLRETLPLSVWKALEIELNIFEESVPHLRETRSPWQHKLSLAWWIVGLSSRGVRLCLADWMFSAWQLLATARVKIKFRKPRKTSTYIDFKGVDFKGGDFIDLKGVDLKGVDLKGVNFKGVNFKGIDLKASDIWNVDFRGANFSKVKLRKDNFDGGQKNRLKDPKK